MHSCIQINVNTNFQLDIIAHMSDENFPECKDGILMPGVICGTMQNVQPNGEFLLERYYGIKHEVQYSCCPNKYPDVTYYVLLRRRPMFYVFNLILPCVLINSIGKKWNWYKYFGSEEIL